MCDRRAVGVMSSGALYLAVFLACLVEAVEALTIVLAAGHRPRLAFRDRWGGVWGHCAVASRRGRPRSCIDLGPARASCDWSSAGCCSSSDCSGCERPSCVPAGLKALHDEDAIYATELAAAMAAPAGRSALVVDWYSFTLSFKGVVLEGLEVVFIVLTLGAGQHKIPLAAVAAMTAFLVVTMTGVAVRAPLGRVPENTMKFVVGVMLTSFGVFWGAEGAGAQWPGADAALLVLAPVVTGFALGARPPYCAASVAQPIKRSPRQCAESPGMKSRTSAFVGLWYHFVVGDDSSVAVGVIAALALTYGLSTTAMPAWWVLPASVAVVLPLSLWKRGPSRRQPITTPSLRQRPTTPEPDRSHGCNPRRITAQAAVWRLPRNGS